MKSVLILLLASCNAQFFDNGSEDVSTFLQRATGRVAVTASGLPRSGRRGFPVSNKQKNLRSRGPPRQTLPPRIPDIVVEKNGDSQFNFGPLGSKAQKQSHLREKSSVVQSTTSVRNNMKSKHQGGVQNGQRHQATFKKKPENNVNRQGLKNIPTTVRPAALAIVPVEEVSFTPVDISANIENESEDGLHPLEAQSFKDTPGQLNAALPLQAHVYNFPVKAQPLKQCFYNPSGYACCNRDLNDEMVRTFEELARRPDFSPCNTQKIANLLQQNCSRRFRVSFEILVGLADYAQRVRFKGDLVCKVELQGRFMLAYATPDGLRAKRDDTDTTPDDNSSQIIIDRSVEFDNSTAITSFTN